MKWTSLVWALGTVGFIGGMGAVVAPHLMHPKTYPASAAPALNKPAKKATKNLVRQSPRSTAAPLSQPQVVTESSLPQTVVSFNGQGVAETNPDLTPVILPRNFPISANPVEFYSTSNFSLIQSISGTINGQSFTVQVYKGTTAPLLALAVGSNGTPIAAKIFGSPLTIAAFRNNSVIVESMPANQSPVWYSFNLITGAIRILTGSPSGFSASSTNIEGIPPGILRNTITPNPNAAPSNANIMGSSFLDTLVKEVNSMLLTAITPNGVMVTRPTSNTAILSALEPTRWQSIAFRKRNGTWVPTQIATQVGSMHLTYDVYGNSVALPYPEMQTVQKEITLGSYSALDTQTGALARLPINLEGATTVGTINTPKIRLHDQNHTLLALTYEAHANGNTFFIPIGWYWFTGLPSFLATEVSPPASTSTTAPSSVTTPSSSPNAVVSPSTGSASPSSSTTVSPSTSPAS